MVYLNSIFVGKKKPLVGTAYIPEAATILVVVSNI